MIYCNEYPLFAYIEGAAGGDDATEDAEAIL